MSVQNTPTAAGATQVPETTGGVYASLFEKINLHPVDALDDIDAWQDSQRLADASADERVTAAVRVFLERLKQSGQQVEKLDKTLLDHHIAELDRQISRQLDTVMHHPEFQQVESLWRGLKHLVDRTDYRQNVRTEILDIAKEDLRQDFEDAPEIVQSGLYWHTYTAEYDTPGGEPVGAVISSYEFDASAQDMALLRNISKVSAAAHMPFIGAVGPKFFLKDSMEEVAAIKDIGNYFDRAEYIKWKSFRDTDDARYIGLTLPRVLGRLSAGGDISVGVMGNMTALAGEKLGLFAHSGPLSLKSGEGPLEVQAQNGGMQLAAEKKVTLTSVSDISFAGKKRITLIGGGSYLKLEAGKIEYGTPQVYLRKVEKTYLGASKSRQAEFPYLPGNEGVYSRGFILLDDRTNEPAAGIAYRLTLSSGEKVENVSNNKGCTYIMSHKEKHEVELTILRQESLIIG